MYNTTIELGEYNDSETVLLLSKALHGKARETVSTLLVTNQNAKEIMDTLELEFGNKKVLAQKIVNEIKNLTSFASKLKSAASALHSCNARYLHSPELIQCIARKIPSVLKYNYDNYASEISNDKTPLENLADFLFRKAQRSVKGGIFDVNELTSTHQASNEKRQMPIAKPAKVYAIKSDDENQRLNETKSSDKQRSITCIFCNRDNHISVECRRFARDSLPRRWFLVRKLRLCYKCLEQGHFQTKCESGNCAQCSQPHHVLLHDPKRSHLNHKNTINSQNRNFTQAQAYSSNNNDNSKSEETQ